MKFRSIAAALAALMAIGALAIAAGPTNAEAGAAPSATGSRPHLLLLHGGSFLFDDNSFEALTRRRAVAAGFVPHYFDYPLGDLPAAVEAVGAEARRLGEQYGPNNVYAYGSSAGGTLAALLAADGLVAAAVAKAPPTNLPAWRWAFAAYGADYNARIGITPAEAPRFSPALLPAGSPLLIYHGLADKQVPAAMNKAFADKFPEVRFMGVAGGHWTDRTRPYLISRSLEWLRGIAARRASAPAVG